jgi:hypothetical protein
MSVSASENTGSMIIESGLITWSTITDPSRTAPSLSLELYSRKSDSKSAFTSCLSIAELR